MPRWFRRHRGSAKAGGAPPRAETHSQPDNRGPSQPSTSLPVQSSTQAAAQSLSQLSLTANPASSPRTDPHNTSNHPVPPLQQDGGKLHNGGVSAVVAKKNYWKMAADKLQEEEPKLTEVIVGVQQAAQAAGNDDFATQLLHTTERRRHELEAKQWKITVGSKEIILREQFDRLIKVVTVLKDVATAAGSLDPIHAGLPLAGFCVLMQMATNDSEQYAAMVAGVEELVTIVARYRHVEEIYRRRVETNLKQDFEQQLVNLYKHIIRYQAEATCYYQRSTIARYVRAIPKLDDPSEVVASIRQKDAACRNITQLFDSIDALERHQEVMHKLDQFQQRLQGSNVTATSNTNVHWIGLRSTNDLFTGRDDLLSDLEQSIQKSLTTQAHQQPCRIVISGMGGLGKSEICVQLAHRLRQLFWGVFWIDVSTTSVAEKAFLDLATRLQIPAQTWEEACQGLGALQQGWLLVLDNADDPRMDYQNYLPPSSYGVVLMTSRNEECSRYATTKHILLKGLTVADARTLLLRAAGIPSSPQPGHDRQSRQRLEDDADVIVGLLQSHPLALIQAGAYVSRGHCTLAAYPEVYEQQRQRLLKYHPTQAKSRYGDVYATFEASADILRSSITEASKDALSLLPVLAAFGPSQLPLRLFELAWKGAQSTLAVQNDDNDMLALKSWHALHLPSCVPVNTKAWDSFRLIEAVSELKLLSLVTTDSQEGHLSVSMHPLVHAWARDRQTEIEQHTSWIEAGCLLALSSEFETWQHRPGQFQRHVESLVTWEMSKIFESELPSKISAILLECGRKLDQMRADSTLSTLIREWFGYMKWDLSVVELMWIDAYELAGQNYLNCGKIAESVSLLVQVVKIKEQTLAKDHPDRLASQHALAIAYEANGQVKEAIALLEQVVKIQEQTLAEDHPSQLASQHVLAGAYRANGQVKEAIALLEQVVKIEEQTLAEHHPDRLASQHALAIVYEANGQVKEAIALLEQVVKIKEQTLAEHHPDRLASQHALAGAYRANGQVKEAIALLEQVVKIKEQTLAEHHPDRLASQHALAIVYEANGQVKEAIALLEQVVKIKEQTLAEDHPDRLASQHVLAGAYEANGQVKEAIALLEQVVKIREQTLAEDHPSRLASQHTLAIAYEANGQVKEAIALLEQVVKIRKQTLAEHHPSQLASQHVLAGAYKANGQVKEAIALLEQVVKIQEQTLAEDHPDRLASQHALAIAYEANGQAKEAIALLEQVVKIKEQTLAEDHPDQLASQHELAGAYEANGQVKEAIALLEQVVKIREQTQAEDHPDRLSSQHNLATYLWELGDHQAALSIMAQVVEIQSQVLDEGHPNRLVSESWLEDMKQSLASDDSE